MQTRPVLLRKTTEGSSRLASQDCGLVRSHAGKQAFRRARSLVPVAQLDRATVF